MINFFSIIYKSSPPTLKLQSIGGIKNVFFGFVWKLTETKIGWWVGIECRILHLCPHLCIEFFPFWWKRNSNIAAAVKIKRERETETLIAVFVIAEETSTIHPLFFISSFIWETLGKLIYTKDSIRSEVIKIQTTSSLRETNEIYRIHQSKRERETSTLLNFHQYNNKKKLI